VAVAVKSSPLLTLVGALLVSCGGAPEPDAADSPRDAPRTSVLFVVVDTLRADRVGCYGAERDTTPAIDALAARGTRFANCVSVAPWTMPSIATMLTGLQPATHGSITPTNLLPEEALSIAETFRAEGYATASVVSNKLIGRDQGFAQGFEYWDETQAKSRKTISTPGVTDAAIEMLDDFEAEGRPFFLFVHYFDPHYDYLPHPEYGFAPEPVGRLDGTQNIDALRAWMPNLTAEEREYLLALYDGEVRFTDDGIGRLLAHLDELGLDDDTVVVVTSDHGEEFLEHGWLGHTRSLYRPVVDVPLVIADPHASTRGAVVDDFVSTVTLAPTLLELAGVDASAHAFDGPSIAATVRGGAPLPAHPVLIDTDFVAPQAGKHFGPAHKSGIVAPDGVKLIHHELRKRFELFDLAADPDERENLSLERVERRKALVATLRETLAGHEARRLPARVRDVDAEQMETLRNLGYAGEGDEGDESEAENGASDAAGTEDE